MQQKADEKQCPLTVIRIKKLDMDASLSVHNI
jgi:hypothetical protein